MNSPAENMLLSTTCEVYRVLAKEEKTPVVPEGYTQPEELLLTEILGAIIGRDIYPGCLVISHERVHL